MMALASSHILEAKHFASDFAKWLLSLAN